jgi:hypothetical protein
MSRAMICEYIVKFCRNYSAVIRDQLKLAGTRKLLIFADWSSRESADCRFFVDFNAYYRWRSQILTLVHDGCCRAPSPIELGS